MRPLNEYLHSALGQAAMLTFAGTAAVVGLVAIWAATSRLHWFARALVVWSSVMLLVPLRLYEPAAIFVFASPLIVATIAGANWRSRPDRSASKCGSRTLTSCSLPLSLADVWGPAALMALLVVGFGARLPRGWWLHPADFLAQWVITITVVSIAYDCFTMRGRRTRQRLLSLVRLATTSLPLNPAPHDTVERGSSSKSKFRFGLRDLFYLMVLAALVIVGVQTIHQRFTWQEWGAFALWGGLLAAIVSLAYGCVVSRWRLIFAPLLAAAIAVTARVKPGIGGPFFAEQFIQCVALGQASRWTGAEKLVVLEIIYSELALLVIVVLSLVALCQLEISVAPLRRLARGTLAALSVPVGLSLAWLYWQMFWLTSIPPKFAGGTNHYDRLVQISTHVDERLFWGSPIPPVAIAKPVVATMAGDKPQLLAELLLLVREANFVPLMVEERVFRLEDIEDFRRRSGPFESFAQVIDAEAVAASESGDFSRAVELAIANIRLGTMLRRGGTRGHAETGKYCESYGYQRLTILRDQLSPESMRSALAATCRAAAEKEDLAIVAARDQAFYERALGWMMRLRYVLQKLERRESWNPDEEINTFNVLVQTDLAIRLFRHDRGRLPTSLDELVPGYLPAVPLDPYAKSKQPLIYRPQDDGFLLYSVGPFGTDNGGAFGNREKALHWSTHDLDVETWIRP
jgi:hypothetical protein